MLTRRQAAQVGPPDTAALIVDPPLADRLAPNRARYLLQW
jgi:hypothetical protein